MASVLPVVAVPAVAPLKLEPVVEEEEEVEEGEEE